MPSYQILYWYDIPTQVRAREGRERASAPLPDRFMEAVDRAAMALGLTGADAYMDAFKWGESIEAEGSVHDIVAAVVADLDARMPEIDWRQTVDTVKAS
jgi:hypothetical protein